MKSARNKNILLFALLFLFVVAASLLTFVWSGQPALAPAGSESFSDDTSDETLDLPPAQPEAVDNKITFIFGGDMMFDRAVDYKFRGDKIFDSVKNLGQLFFDHDISMVNLEGPISPDPIPADSTANNMIFNFPPKVPEVLSSLHINAVSMANNHTLNNGRAGLDNTEKVLKAANILPLGEEVTFGDFSIGHFAQGERKIAVIAINSLENSTDLQPKIAKEISDGYQVIVFPHWGTEYAALHNAAQEKLAHSWIDAGALMVIGSHPHVIEDVEVYKNRPIVYSLGNLLFDQTFSTETQRGLVIDGSLDKSQLTLTFKPIQIKNLQPELLAGAERDSILAKIMSKLTATDMLKINADDTLVFIINP